jgi:hypothetical protein
VFDPFQVAPAAAVLVFADAMAATTAWSTTSAAEFGELLQAPVDRVHVAALDVLVGDDRVLTPLAHAGDGRGAGAGRGEGVLGSRGDDLGGRVREDRLASRLVADSATSGGRTPAKEVVTDVTQVREVTQTTRHETRLRQEVRRREGRARKW